MAKVDILYKDGVDVNAIMALPGYVSHKVEQESKPPTARWLTVEGVDQAALQAVVDGYDHKGTLVKQRSEELKSEADKRVDILLVDQRKSDRVAAFVLRMNDKRLNGETLTPAQQNKLTTLRQWYQYFEDVRAVEDTEKASLSGMTQEQLNNYDPVADPAWPAPPQ